MSEKEILKELHDCGFEKPEEAFAEFRWRLVDGMTAREAIQAGKVDELRKAIGAMSEGYYI